MEVDDEFEVGGLLDWYIGEPFTLQNTIHVGEYSPREKARQGSVAASRISSDSLQEGRIGIAIRREANGPLVRTDGSPRSRPHLAVNWTYFEATLCEQALELPALGAAQHPFLSRPIMGEGRCPPEPIRQVRDGQGIRHRCVVPEDSPEIRQEKKRRAVCPGRQYEHCSLFRSRGMITDDAKAELNPHGQRPLGGLVG